MFLADEVIGLLEECISQVDASGTEASTFAKAIVVIEGAGELGHDPDDVAAGVLQTFYSTAFRVQNAWLVNEIHARGLWSAHLSLSALTSEPVTGYASGGIVVSASSPAYIAEGETFKPVRKRT